MAYVITLTNPYPAFQALLLTGAIFKSAVPDESDEERRELERYYFASFRLLFLADALLLPFFQNGP